MNRIAITLLTLGAIYWLCMIASLCGVAKADIIYDYTANLLEDNIVTIDQETHYYDIFIYQH